MFAASAWLLEVAQTSQQGDRPVVDEPAFTIAMVALTLFGSLGIVGWDRHRREVSAEQDAVEIAAHEVATAAGILAVMAGPMADEATRALVGKGAWTRTTVTLLAAEMRGVIRAGYVKTREDRFPRVAAAVNRFTEHAETTMGNATTSGFDWDAHQAALGELHEDLRNALAAECLIKRRRRRPRWRLRRRV